MMDTDLINEQMMQVDACYWACQCPIQLQAGPFSLKGREYQFEPMSSRSRRMCYIKGTQILGATEMEGLKSFHGMITGKYKLGAAHIFPGQDEVSEYSKSRINPLVAGNRTFIGRYVKTQKSGTDTTSLKKVNGAFFYLRGARQSQKIGDSTESTSSKTAGFSVDRLVFDEVDYMDVNVIEKYKGRMRESPHKEEVYLGNPSHEDFGIDLIFKQSDQRFWFRKCSCSGLISTPAATTVRGSWTCAEKSFPGCVKIRSDGTGYIGCDKCGKELLPWAGDGSAKWVPDYPDKTGYMMGYMASEMISPRCDPAEVLEDYVNPPLGNLADVIRLRLGRPYSSASDKLTKHVVLANCGNNSPASVHRGPCAMGVDVGKEYHAVVIGIRTAKERFEIIKTAKAKDFQDVYDLAQRYNVKSDVIDIGPYYEAARKYQKNSGHKTFLCLYLDTQVTDAVFNTNTGVVKVNKTEIFDRSHRILSEGHVKLPCQCPEIEEFARQCCNCARFEEKDKRSGGIVFRYRPTGDREDHLRSALNYFLLAAASHNIATVSHYRKHRQAVTNNKG